MKAKLKDKVLTALAAISVIGAIVAIVAVVIVADMVCQRYIGPFMTGSNDPVAIALYCKPVK